ncbi:MAG TPA: L-tyrosine/L-tryptophan isonitrile synthase family protein [Pseudonocardiaceae bacterium]|nr:L-tyrosine/L-tryptophan isonitrile synthase family protein [Pseudonocardiaceae bacterium]
MSSGAGVITPPINRTARVGTRVPVISHARSLRALPLHRMRTSSWVSPEPVRLDSQEQRTLVSSLLEGSQAASARLVENALGHLAALTDRVSRVRPPECPREVAVALHRILTRSRFLKGPRSCFPLEAALAQMAPFIQSQQPITILTIGFPFKQHDNGLKAAGPWPDLAELGALLRLRELADAFTALYPPGLRVLVLNDGGYSRPRGWPETWRYRRQLKYYAQLIGLNDTVRFYDQSCFVARMLGPRGWSAREKYRRGFRGLISSLAGDPGGMSGAALVDARLAQRVRGGVLAAVPSFRDILSSLVYSVPVPAPAGSDPRRWACQVLALPDGFAAPGASPELVSARRAVMAAAWDGSVNYLAASLADVAAGTLQHLPPHIRLATVTSRPGCSGFTYLGGSALLPWHGTGCLDGRGLVCAEFLVSLDHRGFLPVYCDLIGDEQPLLMVPFARTWYEGGRRRVDPDLLTGARLRSR